MRVVGARPERRVGERPRPSQDLRSEERQVIYGSLIHKLKPFELFENQYLGSELLRQIFDVDEMLYFVAPGWYSHTDRTNAIDPGGHATDEWRVDYLITEQTQPAPLGSSLGWLIQIDGDARRNEFLNAAWAKAVLPVRPGREIAALEWLRQANVEGEAALDLPYEFQEGDPRPIRARRWEKSWTSSRPSCSSPTRSSATPRRGGGLRDRFRPPRRRLPPGEAVRGLRPVGRGAAHRPGGGGGGAVRPEDRSAAVTGRVTCRPPPRAGRPPPGR
ncbi:hypothetical protein ACFSTC_20145 [Nonomuraea ferruginea]